MSKENINIMKGWILFSLLFAAIFLSSCATMITGSKQQVHVTSNPSEAKVYVNMQEQCITPCTVTVARKASVINYQFVKDGYVNGLHMDAPQINEWYWLSLITIVGPFVDMSTGAAYKYPEAVSYNLQPLAAAPLTPTPTATPKSTSVQKPTKASTVTKKTPTSLVGTVWVSKEKSVLRFTATSVTYEESGVKLVGTYKYASPSLTITIGEDVGSGTVTDNTLTFGEGVYYKQ